MAVKGQKSFFFQKVFATHLPRVQVPGEHTESSEIFFKCSMNSVVSVAAFLFRNEAEIYGTFWRVRGFLKYAILCSCNRVQTGRTGLNRYAA